MISRRIEMGLLCMALATTWLAGCVAPPVQDSSTSGACPAGITKGYLQRKWIPMTDENRSGWLGIPLVAHGWRADRHEMPPEDIPPIYLDWNAYAPIGRPELMTDILCYAAWRIAAYPDAASAQFTSRATAPEWMVNETLDAVVAEYERQTGVPLDWRALEWPALLFEDHFYYVYCHGYTGRLQNGSIDASCPRDAAHDH